MGLNGQNSPKERAQMVAAVDERRTRVASYKVQGLSIRQTQAALAKDGHVNPATGEAWSIGLLSGDVKFLRKKWQEEAAKATDEHIQAELQRLDEVEREAWAAWYRGIGKKQQTYTEQKRGGKDAGKASVKTEELNGDPRYLAIILDCQKRRAALLGLDAPERRELSGPGGGPIKLENATLQHYTDEELHQLEEITTRAAARAVVPLRELPDAAGNPRP